MRPAIVRRCAENLINVLIATIFPPIRGLTI